MSKVAVVILAAGASTRFGGIKQIASVGGQSMAARAAGIAASAGADRVLVVVGAHSGETIAALGLAGHAEQSQTMKPPIEVIENLHWASGQASSVAAALSIIGDDYDAALFMPVDQPFLHALLLQRMVAEWRGGARLVAPAVHGEMRGAPALFGKEYFDELRSLSGDVGGRAVLRRHASQVAIIEVPADQLSDVDTRDEMIAATRKADGLDPASAPSDAENSGILPS
jgi:molybdenum cofactor cytidylyltransferase